MIEIQKEMIGSIPSLVVVDASKKDMALPVVTYFHGFTSAKEHNLPIAYLLAEKGYRVVLPDSMHHGEREGNITPEKLQLSFWDIVIQNVKELELIHTHLEDRGQIAQGKFGLAGTSMGGITTAACLTQYPWIRASAILMGSPKMTDYANSLIDGYRKMGDLPITDEMLDDLLKQLEQLDLSRQPEKLNGRPILFWHGKSDTVVPFDHSRSFYEEIRASYERESDFRFIEEKKQGHKVSRHAILETVDWFEAKL